MSNVVIHIENISKSYALGVISHRTLYKEVQSKISRLLKKEDPNVQIGHQGSLDSKTRFLALDNISLEIEQGDVIGIIGKNGAGKSTLLKILSRVTSPTSGNVFIKGRIASLLEVGTGFHPELTGRENIYLNGAILGMRKKEIEEKFDEIVDFSGIERFIDTPVKRYSSGMYVRLAFAVAAHLDPEILIIDEVLAVGDAEFRKKCLNKMNEASNSGRTIIFVSHDMNAISSLCNKGVLMISGKIACKGNIDTVISEYMNLVSKTSTYKVWLKNERPGDDVVELISCEIINENHEQVQLVTLGQRFAISIIYELKKNSVNVNPGITLFTSSGQVLFVSMPKSVKIAKEEGIWKAECWIPPNLLNNDIFSVRINTHSFYPTRVHFDLQEAIVFEVIERNVLDREIEYKDRLNGAIRPDLVWEFHKVNSISL